MKQVIIQASQSDFGQVDFYSYLPKGQVKENGGCSTPGSVCLSRYVFLLACNVLKTQLRNTITL